MPVRPGVVNTGTPECLKVVCGRGHNRREVVDSASFPKIGSPLLDVDGNTAHCNLMALLASRKPPNNAVRSDAESLWSVSQCGKWWRRLEHSM
jgi:hypothetical protein